MDIYTKGKRSWVMSRIGNKNTKPELVIRKILHAWGYRFRLHKKELPGKPDIVLPRYKVAILVHGCFWHVHKCKRGVRPSTNTKFWDQKLSRNIIRDKKNIRELKALGWKPIVIWGCQIAKIKPLEKKLSKIKAQTLNRHN